MKSELCALRSKNQFSYILALSRLLRDVSSLNSGSFDRKRHECPGKTIQVQAIAVHGGSRPADRMAAAAAAAKAGESPLILKICCRLRVSGSNEPFQAAGAVRGGGKGPQLNSATLGLAGAGLLGLWLVSGFYQVEANELAVVTTFGEYQSVSGPGLHWRIPSPVQNVIKRQALAVQELNIPAAETNRGNLSPGLMLTGDKNIVDVAFTVQWKIKSDLLVEEGQDLPGVAQFVFNIEGPEDLVRMASASSMREVVGRNTLDFVQTDGREEVAQQTKELLQSALDEYRAGIQIERVNLTLAEPPTNEVNEAFRDVQAAEQNQATVIQNARQYTNQVVPEARGEAQRILEDARGYSARVTAEARGQAQRFEDIYENTKKRRKSHASACILKPLNACLAIWIKSLSMMRRVPAWCPICR